MAIYSGQGRSFVSPIQAKTELDGSVPGDDVVYEITAGRRATLMRFMRIVPRLAVSAIAVIGYLAFSVENELHKMLGLYVMLVPAVVYFGALLYTTTFPRQVDISGMRLSLSAREDSIAFCLAQFAVFLSMVSASVVIFMMHWRPTLGNIFALAVCGVFPVAACAFAGYRLRSVLRASGKPAP